MVSFLSQVDGLAHKLHELEFNMVGVGAIHEWCQLFDLR